MLRVLAPGRPLVFRSIKKTLPPSTKFTFTVDDLALLTATNSTHPNRLGGIDNICRGLCVDSTVGLHSDEAEKCSIDNSDIVKFADGKEAFGSNARLCFVSITKNVKECNGGDNTN